MMRIRFFVVMAIWIANVAMSADLHVDPNRGDDASDGIAGPVRTIGRAIQLAQPGDTIHLLPIVYRDWAWFYDKSGEPDRPIILDGHGATLDGCDPLDPARWIEAEPGLYQSADLMPLTDAIVDRWFVVYDGALNRMRRCSKGPSEPWKSPQELQPGEWTFVKDIERSQSARAGYIHGTFWLKPTDGKTLDQSKIELPVRMAGVAMQGNCAHLVVRNLTSTRPYNDGFNLSDCHDVSFQNIQAIDCGDDGVSAHGRCRYRVDGLRSIGNATGVCDTGDSVTSYRNVWIDRCIGFDLYFLDTGTYHVADAHVRSASVRPLYLLGREAPVSRCSVTLDSVWIERVVESEAEVRVSPGCHFAAKRSTFTNLDWQVTGGEIALENCVIESGPMSADTTKSIRMHLWPDARWRSDGGVYSFAEIRVGDRTYGPSEFDLFRQATLSDRDSHWTPHAHVNDGQGVDRKRLPSF